MSNGITAEQFEKKLYALLPDEKRKSLQRHKPGEQGVDDYSIGVRMGSIFTLAKQHSDMPVGEIEKLMESPVDDVRVGALSIMGQCAKGKKCSRERLKDLYELYIRRHDRINNWGLVDLAAYYVVGQYLADKPRDILYKLAVSKDTWERRSAIVATAHFTLKQKQVDDTFRIAEMLIGDDEDFVNRGSGWMLRTAGDVDRPRLIEFLDKHAATMPRITLRYSIEKLEKEKRDHYINLKRK